MNRKLIIGTRGSQLAMWQANHIKDRLAAAGIDSELKVIKTQGDIIQHLRLDKLEGKGFFTKELEEELLSSTIDLAVHSHKDLPTVNPPGLIIAAVSERESPAELLIVLKDCVDIKKRLSLKHNATVGTSSNRRKAQLLSLRPDLEFDDLRGNLQTRIQKLRDENYDAIILAKAGVERIDMDLSEFYVEEIPPVELIPAPAQGVLAIQIRESDQELYEALQVIHNKEVAEVIAVERKVLNLFDAGCHAPLGCYCRKSEGKYEAWTSVADTSDEFPDRLYIQRDSTEGMAEEIFAKFAKDRKLPSSIFISRDIDENTYFARAMAKHNIQLDARSLIRIYPIINKLDPFILKHVDWVFFASRNGIDHFFSLDPQLRKHTRIGVVGRGSEEALRKYDRVADFSGDDFGIHTDEIGLEFAKIANGQTVLFPRAKDSLETIQKAMSADTKIIDMPVYETVLDENVASTTAEVLIFTSPSNVEAYFIDNLIEPGQQIISIGKSTGAKIAEMGLPYVTPYSPDEIGLTEAVFGLKY
ncbi:hydroxymethylbilane synthase [Sphingobacterium spiritivorum]|uniref:Porphobilinogen deaminase n=1 Tax=Sphingobacterium spiritivorum ATCC 33861 TaxID=525373 RepID=D7VHB0_SPHSI|nr:hydroxymethylbilane synthase [Sphingobacterium spiritivorum]EFK59462.1 hydroxymethylbilane synthase [Sphingobacterium spiritivorum ATCC 33861]QQT33859.1 hydroxymethylbilane synthase [Sphingobacterium spiritivorum]WQD34677.1 hydroxymethylbilane synthase [Sphingobacterium spiritivorum]SUI97674.1 Porphobilinogen deaminase [Sphingobacterium spiritivorum]